MPTPNSEIRRRRFLQICTALLAFVGIQFWLVILHGEWGTTAQVELFAIAIIAATIPPIHRVIWNILRSFRRPSPKTRLATTLAIFILATLFLIIKALSSGRDLFPLIHDESQFLLQARMLAAGRLWE